MSNGMKLRRSISKFFPKIVENARKVAKNKKKPLRLMFQDEARFGRISDPRRCWSPPKCRPIVNTQIVREYTYLYAAVSPQDGASNFLILPAMTKACMDIFLEELSSRYIDEHILLICDGAPCHQLHSSSIPDNITMETLPPYCPDLNPVENIWDELRETFFHNRLFASMQGVEEQLVTASLYYESQPKVVKSISSWPWIKSTY